MVLKVVAVVKKMVRRMFDIGGWVVMIAVAMVVMCPSEEEGARERGCQLGMWIEFMASLEARVCVCVYKMTVKLSVQPTVANGDSDA